MADTLRGSFPEKICSDCGTKGCVFLHNGDLVPKGEIGNFCGTCWTIRNADFEETGIAKPLGVKWELVSKEFSDRELKIETESGSVYALGEPDASGWRNVRREGLEPLSFTRGLIKMLRIGKSMCLETISPGSQTEWITAPVVSIR